MRDGGERTATSHIRGLSLPEGLHRTGGRKQRGRELASSTPTKSITFSTGTSCKKCLPQWGSVHHCKTKKTSTMLCMGLGSFMQDSQSTLCILHLEKPVLNPKGSSLLGSWRWAGGACPLLKDFPQPKGRIHKAVAEPGREPQEY